MRTAMRVVNGAMVASLVAVAVMLPIPERADRRRSRRPLGVPAGRRYLLELRMDPPNAVTLAGHGELARLGDPHEGGPGWYADRRGFVRVRLPDRPGRLATTLRT